MRRKYDAELLAYPFTCTLEKVKHHAAGGGPAERGGGMKGGEDQHVLQLRQNRLGIFGRGENAVILHPAIGADVGFDHQRVGVGRRPSTAQTESTAARRGV